MQQPILAIEKRKTYVSKETKLGRIGSRRSEGTTQKKREHKKLGHFISNYIWLHNILAFLMLPVFCYLQFGVLSFDLTGFSQFLIYFETFSTHVCGPPEISKLTFLKQDYETDINLKNNKIAFLRCLKKATRVSNYFLTNLQQFKNCIRPFREMVLKVGC